MGQIWAARRTGRLGLPKTAVKTALPEAGQSRNSNLELLFDEGRRGASTTPMSVVPTNATKKAFFLAMEWIDGASLLNLLESTLRRVVSTLDGRVYCCASVRDPRRP
jgi:hypothetical protein